MGIDPKLSLARLAIGGFAPGGHVPVPVLTMCAAGLGATLLTGRAPPEGPNRKRSARRCRRSRLKELET